MKRLRLILLLLTSAAVLKIRDYRLVRYVQYLQEQWKTALIMNLVTISSSSQQKMEMFFIQRHTRNIRK